MKTGKIIRGRKRKEEVRKGGQKEYGRCGNVACVKKEYRKKKRINTREKEA